MSTNQKECSYGVDVCLEEMGDNSPHCPHGPTLLFERYGQGQKSGQRFYACSACRDRKDCNFYHLADQPISKQKKEEQERQNKASQPPASHEEYYQRLKDVQNLRPEQRMFCQTCGLVLLPKEHKSHRSHILVHNLTTDQCHTPTALLRPLAKNKANAQYLFSDKTISFILRALQNLGYEKVLCLGAPRIHEAIIQQQIAQNGQEGNCLNEPKLESLLLDIDHRFQQFYSPNQFCRYNMFNHHFFDGEKSKEVFTNFLCGKEKKSTVIVTDPPFGGLVEVLAHNLKTIQNQWKCDESGATDLPVLWFFPYFMEHRILQCLPSFTMLDYKVDYENHSVFTSGSKGRKHGSPVRIFTNIEASKIELPADDGYRYCKDCEKYVSVENVHCSKCSACTSKDGRTYHHCDLCDRCVKPSYVHCSSCGQCALPDHVCGEMKAQGCHICGNMGHKRKECPNKGQMRSHKKVQGRKRPKTDDSFSEGFVKKRKKNSKKSRKKK